MPIVHIEHPIPDYDGWKQAFDSDPAGRERSHVRRYQITRPMDDPHYVMIDLEFDTKADAEAFLVTMRRCGVVWKGKSCRIRRRESSRSWRAKRTDILVRGAASRVTFYWRTTKRTGMICEPPLVCTAMWQL